MFELADFQIELSRFLFEFDALRRLLLLPVDRLSKPLLRIALALAPFALLPRGGAEPLAVCGGLARLGCGFCAFLGNRRGCGRSRSARPFHVMLESRRIRQRAKRTLRS